MTDLIVIPTLGKRKAPEPPSVPTTEKKQKFNPIHPLIERNFDEDIGRICWPLLNSGKNTSWSLREADHGWLLHIEKLGGITTKTLLDSILSEMNTRYELQKIVYGLALKVIDIRFTVVKSTDRRTGVLSNVLKLEQSDAPADLIDKAQAELKGENLDINDVRLISRLIAHAEGVQRENTPQDLIMQVETPSGFTIKCSGETPTETKTLRSNYNFIVDGYDEMSRAEFDSFAHVLPFHAHSPSVDWDQGRLCVQLEPYEKPRSGHPVDLYMEMA